MRLLSMFVILVGLSALTAAPDKGKDDKDDFKKLTGDWTITAWKQSGEALDKDDLEGSKWAVKDGKYKFQLGGNEEEGTIKVDPSKKTPTIDLTITEGNDKGKEQPGIYKIDGETITFCFARPGAAAKDRPTEFTSTEENQQILITMKRKKRDD
jgi:uncharacterized protein (TIGR03067 family)